MCVLRKNEADASGNIWDAEGGRSRGLDGVG